MVKITFSNLDEYVYQFYSDLETGNISSLDEYVYDTTFVMMMCNNSENSAKSFRAIQNSLISIENKRSILSFFYDHITVDKKERVLPRVDMKREEFVDHYTKVLINIPIVKKVDDQDKEYIKFTIFRDMVSSNEPNRRFLRYYVDCSDDNIEEYYEKVTQLIIDNKESYQGELIEFIEILMTPGVNISKFFEGDGYAYMKRILSIWSFQEITEMIKCIKEDFEFEINSREYCKTYVTIMMALECILEPDLISLSEKLKERELYVDSIINSKMYYDD